MAAPLLTFAAADTGLLALLPSDAQTVASVNVDSSRSSGFGQFMLRQMASNDSGFQDMVQQTGFDPRKDLQTVVFAGFPSTEKGKGRFLMLARGVFNEQMIASHATAKGMTPSDFGGTTVLVSSGTTPAGLAFPETGLAAFGDLASVQQVLNNRANPVVLADALQAQIKSVSANNDAWFASTVPGTNLMSHLPQGAGPMGNSQQGSQLMQAVVQSSGGVRFGDTVQMSLQAMTRSDKDAVSLTDFIRFISSAVQMQRQNDPRAAILAPAMDSMTLRADGRQVYTSLSIPEADFERLLGNAPHAHRRTR